VTPDISTILASLQEERTSAFLYRSMEAVESDNQRAALFAKLRAASERQAALWEERLREQHASIPVFHPPLRARLVARLIQWLGPRRLLPVLAAMKVRGLSIYRAGPLFPSARTPRPRSSRHGPRRRDLAPRPGRRRTAGGRVRRQ
jgi:hypothetical protein